MQSSALSRWRRPALLGDLENTRLSGLLAKLSEIQNAKMTNNYLFFKSPLLPPSPQPLAITYYFLSRLLDKEGDGNITRARGWGWQHDRVVSRRVVQKKILCSNNVALCHHLLDDSAFSTPNVEPLLMLLGASSLIYDKAVGRQSKLKNTTITTKLSIFSSNFLLTVQANFYFLKKKQQNKTIEKELWGHRCLLGERMLFFQWQRKHFGKWSQVFLHQILGIEVSKVVCKKAKLLCIIP